jgi:hypothetical protein
MHYELNSRSNLLAGRSQTHKYPHKNKQIIIRLHKMKPSRRLLIYNFGHHE